eukprot:g1654.t1
MKSKNFGKREKERWALKKRIAIDAIHRRPMTQEEASIFFEDIVHNRVSRFSVARISSLHFFEPKFESSTGKNWTLLDWACFLGRDAIIARLLCAAEKQALLGIHADKAVWLVWDKIFLPAKVYFLRRLFLMKEEFRKRNCVETCSLCKESSATLTWTATPLAKAALNCSTALQTYAGDWRTATLSQIGKHFSDLYGIEWKRTLLYGERLHIVIDFLKEDGVPGLGNCSHSFCKECMFQIFVESVQTATGVFNCPLCKGAYLEDFTIGKKESLDKFLLLPDTSNCSIKRKKKKRPPFRALDYRMACKTFIGTSRASRCEKFLLAAKDGLVPRLKAIIEAGVDVDCVNEYGQSALHLAKWRGKTGAVQFLESIGASSKTSCTHHGLISSFPVSVEPFQLKTVFPFASVYVGAGSFVIDHLLHEDVLRVFDSVFETIPFAVQKKKTKYCSERKYYCDESGTLVDFISQEMANALKDVATEILLFPHMRMLHYMEKGQSLSPHLDLSRTNAQGIRSTHTFLLYLETVDGGETALLDHVECEGKVLFKCGCVRGRIFLFPHDTPHCGLVVEETPKRLIRGEVYMKST